MSGFLPNSDPGLLAWSLNFKTLITATPTAYGLTAALATAYGTLHDAYATAYAAVEPSIRTRGAVQTKNTARSALKANARLLANLVYGTGSVTNAQRTTLGLSVRHTRVPVPPPSVAPGLDVVSVVGWTVKVKLHDSASSSRRGKPHGVNGASVFSYVGPTPPTTVSDWHFEGNTGTTLVDIAFHDTLAPGTRVWVTAFWFNGRKESGPLAPPVGTNLQAGGVMLAA